MTESAIVVPQWSLRVENGITSTLQSSHRMVSGTESLVRLGVTPRPRTAVRSSGLLPESLDRPFYRSSVFQLEGESGPPVIVLELRSVPGGDYEIRAAVVDAAGHELGSVQKEAIVIGVFGGQ